jgi:dTDP-4-dehydrorhamnose reductase
MEGPVRYVVLGARGQLARDLCPLLEGEVVPLTHDQVDLTRPGTLRDALTHLRPDVVINCAAYNLVDRAESEPGPAYAVNTWGVRDLGRLSSELECTLVHFSTDYVFGLDESRDQPWTESDLPGPLSVYGLSKLAGEAHVRALCPRHMIVRTCGLYGLWGSGGKGGNFVETMVRLADQGRPVRVVADQVCTPTFTQDLAAATVALLSKGKPGTYHVTNAGSCTWHTFAQAIFEAAGRSVEVTPITSQQYGAPARRPAYSVLAAEGLCKVGLSPLRPWREALADYLELRSQRASAR